VSLTTASHLQRVDRIDPIASRDQRRHPGPAVGLDTDQDLDRLGALGQVLADQLAQRHDSRDSLRQPALASRRVAGSITSTS